MWITIAFLGILLLLDQVSKYLTELFLVEGKVVQGIPYILSFTKVYNTGAAWSILDNSTWILFVISLVATGILIYFITKNDWKKKKCYSVAITLMLAGAAGNLIDRGCSLIYPQGRMGVVDMLILEPLDQLWVRIFGSSFPIFNVADACLVIGIVFLAIEVLFFQERREKRQ